MLIIIPGVFLILVLLGVPIIFKPSRPALKQLSDDAFEITNVGYGTLEKLPYALMIVFLLFAVLMSISVTNLAQFTAEAIFPLTGFLLSSAVLFWFRSRRKSYRFNSVEAKAELIIYQFGKARKVGEYSLPKPLTALTVEDTNRDSVYFYWTKWKVIGGKEIKIEHRTDNERKYFRDWLRQNGCLVISG